MKNRLPLFIVALFAVSTLWPATASAAGDCAAKAVSKTGKPLHGAAKTAFIKKCEREAGGAVTEEKAVPEKTAQQGKMASCNQEAKGKTGDERKAFMKACLSK